MGVTTRIYELHRLFKQGKRLSKQQLLDRLEVSNSTLKRDMDVLRDQFGAPLECDRSDNLYYYDLAHGDFELPGLWFNQSELYALLASQQLLESVQPGLLSQQLSPLKTRIRKILEESGHSSDTLASCITLQPIGNRSLPNNSFASIAAATLDGTTLQIEYAARSKGETSHRRIHPKRLLYYRDNWYAIAWCEKAQGLRTFSLDRIKHWQNGPGPQHPVADDLIDAHLGSGFGIFSGDSEEWAVLRFTEHAARWVADAQWHPKQIGQWREGRYELHLPYANPTELVMEILKYGAEVEVVSPASLREEVIKRLGAALEKYQGGA